MDFTKTYNYLSVLCKICFVSTLQEELTDSGLELFEEEPSELSQIDALY